MELAATGDLTPYRHYKTETVSRFLHQALDQMKSGTYGVCVVCGEDIPIKRLELVPAALACVSCDGKRGGST
ncbi:MAG TPA: TraR/DksA C4-type zinc finger protein [bacterium]|nr:TraR/DksA C4-type zinc finger protein [bacterium]